MTDDLKERLRINLYNSWGDESDVGEQAISYITELEARLAAAEAEVQRIKEINVAHCRAVNTLLVCESRMETRAKAAEAGEDALVELLRPLADENPLPTCNCLGCRVAAALAAYEARRKG